MEYLSRILSVLFISIITGLSVSPQTIQVKELNVPPQRIQVIGIVKDELTLVPVNDVNIKINGTNKGTSSDKTGRFSLVLDKIPTSITLSCVGYEPVYYEIGKVQLKPIVFILRQTVYNLKEVDISAKKYKYVFKDQNYSVLDYEIMDDQLLLLVFRYQLKCTDLILLTLAGDTIAITQVPEMKPQCLFKDFIGNIHYISSKGNAFQCYYNDEMHQFSFPYKTTYDSLRIMLKSFLFKTSERYYFQEFTTDGFGTNIGFYDKNGHKEYIRFVSGETTRKKYSDDIKFYSNSGIPFGEPDIQALKLFFYKRINMPIVCLGENNLAVFNFSEDEIELMNQKGKVYRSVPISFHKENEGNLLAALILTIGPFSDWKWRGKILVDEYYRDVYTTFQKNGMVQIRKIDLENGNLTRSYDLLFPFPEKIQVYKGDAYFLNKDIGGEFEKWKLIKVKL
jgi:hypothetical protein